MKVIWKHVKINRNDREDSQDSFPASSIEPCVSSRIVPCILLLIYPQLFKQEDFLIRQWA